MQELIELAELEFEGPESRVWVAPNGKEVPYTAHSAFVGHDGWSDFYIEMAQWPKNITISVSVICGEGGAEIDSEDRWAIRSSYQICKVPYDFFCKNKDRLLNQAIEFCRNH